MPFKNDILGGEELVRSGIRSQNFTEGPPIEGWRITRDGDATFTSVNVSGGTIEGSTIIGGTIETGTSGRRIVIDSTVPELQIYDATGDLVFTLNASGLTAYLGNETNEAFNIDLSGGVVSLNEIDGAGGNAGVAGVVNPILLDTLMSFDIEQDFTSFENGWSAVNSTSLHMMPDGYIHMSLYLTGGTTADGTVVANLPNGYIPDSFKTIPIACDHPNTSSPARSPSVNVNATGTVTVFGLTSSTTFIRTEAVYKRYNEGIFA